ncbi:MAG TPA: hypothetical protein VGI10_30175 [Polyangiaceae bacterium]|jgi:hypothetical protein
MQIRTRLGFCLPLLATVFATGCALKHEDPADEYREAVPSAQSVNIDGPGSANGTSSTAALSSAPQAHTLGSAPPGTPDPSGYAKWYGFTRDERDGVNSITLAILGGVSLIVHSEPTSTTSDSATWGPYTDALDPASYRLRVQRVAPGEYDYVLEGRPKASSSDADYQTVLSGKGYGRNDARHGQGAFTVDLDAARALDPYKHPNDSGSVAFEYQLPANIDDDLTALPRTISATVVPQGESHYAIESQANVDHTGSLHVTAHADIDASKTTALEDVQVESRYRADGAGRADITISGGDVPATIGTVTASECWGSDFMRSYYTDSANIEPSAGDAAACVYAGP